MKNVFITVALAVALHAQTKIEIDASKPAAYQIPRAIYGTFLEPIGNSTYNGLWAEILENPSFEENLWSAAGIRRMTEAEPSLVRSSQMGLPLRGSRSTIRKGPVTNRAGTMPRIPRDRCW
ncbi:MAG: hypothetical protein M3Z85_16840 [Acidobacteriota bacterium]|nr:hypothetical protein [Acidobacteriota bacterium]